MPRDKIKVFEEIAALLQNAHSFNYTMFKTEFGVVILHQITVQHEMIKSEDEVAVKTMGVRMECTYRRIISMAWHLEGLAGMLAMMASSNTIDRDKFVARIISDFKEFERAFEKIENNLFIAELLQSSPFYIPFRR